MSSSGSRAILSCVFTILREGVNIILGFHVQYHCVWTRKPLLISAPSRRSVKIVTSLELLYIVTQAFQATFRGSEHSCEHMHGAPQVGFAIAKKRSKQRLMAQTEFLSCKEHAAKRFIFFLECEYIPQQIFR